MKKWYRHPVIKILLVLTALVTPVIAGPSLTLLGVYVPDNVKLEELFQDKKKPYEETDNFMSEMISAATMKIGRVEAADQLETDGKYDPDKLIDVLEYAGTEGYSEEHLSGLEYRLGDLVDWGKRANTRGDLERLYFAPYDEKSIIVCQKTDGAYFYYWMKEFRKLLSEGSLRADNDEEGQERFLNDLENGYLLEGESNLLWDEKGELVYVDVWTFDGGMIEEEYAPNGAKDILSVVNNTPELSGKLAEIYDCLGYAVNRLYSLESSYKNDGFPYENERTNFTYLFVSKDKKKAYTNNSGFQNYEDVEKSLTAIKNNTDMKYMVLRPDRCEDNLSMEPNYLSGWRDHDELYRDVLGEDYIVAAAVDTSYPVDDIFYRTAENYNQYIPYVGRAAKALLISAALFLVAIVWLTAVAGRRAEEGSELYLHPFDRWRTELSAAIVVLPWLAATMLISSAWSGIHMIRYASDADSYYYGYAMTTEDVIVISVYSAVTAACFLIGWLSLVRRIKGRILWKNSIMKMLLLWSKKVVTACFESILTFWRQRRVLWKVTVAYGVFVLFHWFCVAAGYGIPGSIAFLMFLVEAAAGVFLIRNALEKQQIKDGIKEIAAGSLDYKFPVKKFQGGDYQDMSENLENIGNGLQRAVEKSMRDERLKTDLITNVSHDIKTPLTSIINYVDLLKRENFDDPKVKGYLDILEMKAQRLKTLTEDVVEASKVSSGNISLEYMDVDLVEMLNQTIGELSEKMDARQLKVIASLPEEPAIVHVDGRRMWRVLENIFNNAAKYAMLGTRVYADLKKDGKQILFSLKNVSEQPLNFSSDELTERFIRGDVSRSTEGSGLGLSIAKSLTEMQGGKFELYLDGDLFKVTIMFEEKK